jgi:hypothetical protein
MKRSAWSIVAVLLCVLSLQSTVTHSALKAPLPTPPAQEVIDAVIASTNGAQYTPLYVPASVVEQLNGFAEPFTGVTLDASQAVHYINTSGNLLETLIPVAGLGSETLAPDMIAPRKKPKPGKPPKPEAGGMVIGAWFQPELGARWIVVTFKNNGDADKVRFYKPNNSYTESSLIKGKFKDDFANGQVEPVDEGAVISDKRSCITVGLDQVCWGPVDHGLVRDETKPEKRTKKAEKKFAKLYELGVDFDEKNAVPDLLGRTQREACAAFLNGATSFSLMDGCKANAILAAAKNGDGDDPIALLILASEADIRTFDTAGNPTNLPLPAGSYLVLPTPVASTDAGTPTVLFLVGLNGSSYLIPSSIMQGFGEGAIGNTAQAGIRDGFARYRMFGW